MIHKLIVPTALVALLNFGCLHPSGQVCASEPVLNETHAEKVDKLFAYWSKDDTPGAAVVVIKDGQIELNRCYGMANLEDNKPIEPDTAFLLASVTKQFTAMAIMMLADRGKLGYDDPLSKFFPQFPPYAQKITLRHLLNHSAGFPEYDHLFIASGQIDRNWPRSAKSEPASFEPTSKDALSILAEVQVPHFPAGEQFEYSNSGYVILAQIVEKVSGQSFADFLQRHIFQPLGMKRSLLYDETRPKVPNVATSYRYTLKDGSYRDIDYAPQNAIYGEDNVYTTIEDMVKWDQALYTEKLVKTATLREAFTPGKLNSGEATIYGFGWFVRPILGLDAVDHGGSWLGFRTGIVRFPGERFSVVVLANSAQLKASEFAKNISKIYLADKMTSSGSK